ncbi:hypothetical protein LINGRAHAP2_LOCUS11961 [Linum grandiflorum]
MEGKMQKQGRGTRPYECVKRAWHSVRLQSIRGSLIQEIFRVVNEAHSSMTKKNKEWQDKLPAVVLKAEEILYSKATSQAEYMDLTTLWDRTNDAINTIIRRDNASETGQFLHPCIEAALNLGCPATQGTRSHKNCSSSNLRCYLTGSNIVQSDKSIRCSTNTKKECRPAPAVYPLYYGNCVDKEKEEVQKDVKKTGADAEVTDDHNQFGNGIPMKKRKAEVFPHEQQQKQPLCLKPRLSI